MTDKRKVSVDVSHDPSVFPGPLMERIRDDLLKVSCGSSTEIINAVYASLDEVAEASPGCISDYDVSIQPSSPEEDLLREIHEEPRDEIEFTITLRLKHKLEYVCSSFLMKSEL